MVGIVLLLVGMCFLFDSDQDRAQSFATSLFFLLLFLFQYLSIVPHELAHAVAAWLMGFQVHRIGLGRGNRLAKWRIGRTFLEIRSIPVVGFISCSSLNANGLRWRLAVIVAAGPLANIALAVLAFVVMRFDPGYWFDSGRGVTLMAVAIANLVLVFSALFGRAVTTSLGNIKPDGRRLWELLISPRNESTAIKQNLLSRIHWLTDLGDFPAAIDLANKTAAQFCDGPEARILLAYALLSARDHRAATDILRGLIAENPKQDARRAFALNAWAWADLMLADSDLLGEADALSGEAYQLVPWDPAIQSTRGLYLVESGRLDEGVALLRQSLRGMEIPENRATDTCSLGIAYAKQGQKKIALSLLKKARRLDPNCEMLSRAQAAIA